MIKLAINGFGRIGRLALRAARARDGVEIVAINDLAPAEPLAYLVRHDSVHGPCRDTVALEGATLRVGTAAIALCAERDPLKLPWADRGVDVVLECTGAFRTREAAAGHLAAGARRVVVSAPMDGADATFCLGVNDLTFDAGRHHVVSNASCTTNALAGIAKTLHEAFGIERGFINTTHAYTSSQSLVDTPMRKLRRGRAGALALVPTTTGAARALGLVVPELAGRLDGLAVRAPVPDGSLVDLTCVLAATPTPEDVNAVLQQASEGAALRGILGVSNEELVSSDIVGDARSSVIDACSTMTLGPLVKVLAWYDNEWAYANRLVECAILVASGKRPAPGTARPA